MLNTLDSFRLDGMTAVVTGASSGLGEGFARALAGVGANLVLAARRGDRLDQLANILRATGATVDTVVADVTDPVDCANVAEVAHRSQGRIDVLINNAGTISVVGAVKEPPESFRRTIDVNLNGAFWMARACAPRMHQGGSIVNVASVYGQIAPRYPAAAYAASKAGVIGLTRDLAAEWTRRRNIRVNALCPGFFESEMTSGLHDDIGAMLAEHSMMGRFGAQQEIDTALLFLASPASSYVTGTTLTVDGGLSSY